MIRRYEEELQEQLEIDARIAQELQEEEMRASADATHQSVLDRDVLLAQKLQAKEKQKLLRRRIAKEKREVDRVRRFNGSVNDNPLANGEGRRFPESNIEALAEGYVDLTDLCMKPPPGLTDEELRAFQAEQDEELARFLQEQEAKRTVTKEKLTVIETQDHEIARVLQEQERAKARRIKEKARQKALRKQNGAANGDAVSQATSEEYMTVRDEYDPVLAGHDPDVERQAQADTSPPQSLPNFHNIAMDLDPTYKQTHAADEDEDEQLDPNGLHFASLCRVSPCASETDSPMATPTATVRSADQTKDAASYLPVQGHRRTSPEKKKKLKDNCRTQ